MRGIRYLIENNHTVWYIFKYKLFWLFWFISFKTTDFVKIKPQYIHAIILPNDSKTSEKTPLVNVKISWLKNLIWDRLLKELIWIIDKNIIEIPTKKQAVNLEILNLLVV